jgi:hypothetical protein
VRGPALVELGQLEGRSFVTTMVGDFGSHSDTTPDRAVAEWFVTANPGTNITCSAVHQRGGTVRETVTLQ